MIERRYCECGVFLPGEKGEYCKVCARKHYAENRKSKREEYKQNQEGVCFKCGGIAFKRFKDYWFFCASCGLRTDDCNCVKEELGGASSKWEKEIMSITSLKPR